MPPEKASISIPPKRNRIGRDHFRDRGAEDIDRQCGFRIAAVGELLQLSHIVGAAKRLQARLVVQHVLQFVAAQAFCPPDV